MEILNTIFGPRLEKIIYELMDFFLIKSGRSVEVFETRLFSDCHDSISKKEYIINYEDYEIRNDNVFPRIEIIFGNNLKKAFILKGIKVKILNYKPQTRPILKIECETNRMYYFSNKDIPREKKFIGDGSLVVSIKDYSIITQNIIIKEIEIYDHLNFLQHTYTRLDININGEKEIKLSKNIKPLKTIFNLGKITIKYETEIMGNLYQYNHNYHVKYPGYLIFDIDQGYYRKSLDLGGGGMELGELKIGNLIINPTNINNEHYFDFKQTSFGYKKINPEHIVNTGIVLVPTMPCILEYEINLVGLGDTEYNIGILKVEYNFTKKQLEDQIIGGEKIKSN